MLCEFRGASFELCKFAAAVPRQAWATIIARGVLLSESMRMGKIGFSSLVFSWK
jgi:hypothetical protein